MWKLDIFIFAGLSLAAIFSFLTFYSHKTYCIFCVCTIIRVLKPAFPFFGIMVFAHVTAYNALLSGISSVLVSFFFFVFFILATFIFLVPLFGLENTLLRIMFVTYLERLATFFALLTVWVFRNLAVVYAEDGTTASPNIGSGFWGFDGKTPTVPSFFRQFLYAATGLCILGGVGYAAYKLGIAHSPNEGVMLSYSDLISIRQKYGLIPSVPQGTFWGTGFKRVSFSQEAGVGFCPLSPEQEFKGRLIFGGKCNAFATNEVEGGMFLSTGLDRFSKTHWGVGIEPCRPHRRCRFDAQLFAPFVRAELFAYTYINEPVDISFIETSRELCARMVIEFKEGLASHKKSKVQFRRVYERGLYLCGGYQEMFDFIETAQNSRYRSIVADTLASVEHSRVSIPEQPVHVELALQYIDDYSTTVRRELHKFSNVALPVTGPKLRYVDIGEQIGPALRHYSEPSWPTNALLKADIDYANSLIYERTLD